MLSITADNSLKLPLDAVTQTFGFFGRKGSGKTYAAGVLTESFLAAGVQVVVLDPIGNWYGLRLSKTGKSPSGFEIPILGGEHGDIPLAVTGGALVAQTIVETGTSAVLDVSQFRKGERKRFMADFAEELFHRKKSHREPMHLVIEEAQLFAPQMAKGEERMLGAIEDLVRLGRNYGIGASMISQRPQSVNTEVRNQCEPLVVFQLVAKHERDAVKGWMQHMGVDADLEELSRLKTGECFFWSPAWLERFVRTRFRPKETFDASSTPAIGTESRTRKLKALKLDKLSAAMADTIAEAKANDPAELKKRIASLERELKAQKPVVDQDAIERALAERDRHFRLELKKLAIARDVLIGRLEKINELSHYNGEAPQIEPPPRRQERKEPRPPRAAPDPSRSSRPRGEDVPSGDLPKGEAKILTALIQFPDGLAREQLTVLTGYKRSSRDTYIQRLREKGLVDTRGSLAIATDEGQAALPDAEPLPTGEELQDYWLNRLPAGERVILEILIEHYPAAVHRDELSEATGYKRSSRDTYLHRMRAKQLVEITPDGVRASETLF